MAKKNSKKAQEIHDEIIKVLEASGSSEARVMAEVINDTDGYDLAMVDAVASEFQGWAAFVRGRVMAEKPKP